MAEQKHDIPQSEKVQHEIPVHQVSHSLSSARRRFKIIAPLTLSALLLYTLHVIVFQPLALWHLHGGKDHYYLPSEPLGNEHVLLGKRAEDLFLSIPSEESAINASRLYATKPHLAGSLQDLVTAKYFLEHLQAELGIKKTLVEPIFSAGSPDSRNATLSITQSSAPRAWIDVYYPVMNTPLDRRLTILNEDGEAIWEADLKEQTDETDPEAHEYGDAVPTWHGLSRGGEVEGKLVYAHYGRKEDYDALVDQGVDFNGKIVITRYGGIFRGLKVKRAQELGAAGVLIYSDPRDDGTVTPANGYATYPHGPARNPTSVQRGSVQFLSIYPGDPTTPGYPSYENSTRTNGTNIPSIPSLPISWANAEVLFKEIGAGGLNRTVKLVNHVDTKVTPIWNTMGVIPGYIKDEVVVIGNHRDAWVMGATDPSSGTASAHEVIRGFGALLRKGWKPMRTIVIASWDAEEYGLIGSTEWGEDFADWINEHVVAYLNLDSSVSGSRFRVAASPSLAHLVRNTAQEISHPTSNKSEGRTLWDATRDDGVLFGEREDLTIFDAEAAAVFEADMKVSGSLGVSPLGSGSDYTVFLQRLGVASANGGFASTLHDPVYHYHSVFDSERWQEIYGDPGFFRHVAVAKHLGLQTLRLSGSIILPLNTSHYAYELDAYLDRVEDIALKADPSLQLDLSPLRDSIKKLQAASHHLDKEKRKAEHELIQIIRKWKRRHSFRSRLHRKVCRVGCWIKRLLGRDGQCACSRHGKMAAQNEWRAQGPEVGAEHELAYAFALHAGLDTSDAEALTSHGLPRRFPIRRLKRAVRRVQAVNKKLIQFERGFISDEGIKDREWYKHLGVAPGKWLGYGATTLPALTESLTIDRNVTLAEYEARRIKTLLDVLTKSIQVHRHRHRT